METPISESAGSLQALSNDLAAAVERIVGAVVGVNARQRIHSSGVIWRQSVVVTAAHTIKRDEEITIIVADGRNLPATLAGRDSGTDLAVLRFDGAGLNPAEVGDAASLKVGHLVLAVGRTGERGPSASLGVISALGESWRTWRGGHIDRFVRPDLAFYPGFSGGPLVDAQGRVVGINTSGLSRSGGLTIPASTVNRVVEELLTKGSIARAYIGVGMQPVRLPDALTSRLSLPGQSGVIVLSVEPGGPAERAGLLIGDILVSLDSVATRDTDDVQSVLVPERVGRNLNASVVRGGELIQLAITVGERPQRGR